MSRKRKWREEKRLDDDDISFEKESDDDETSSKKKAGDVEGAGCILLHASWEPHIRETWNPATKKNIIDDRFKKDEVLKERNKETVDELVGLSQPLRNEMRNKRLIVGADNCAEEMELGNEVLSNVGDKLGKVQSMETCGNCDDNLEEEIQHVNDPFRPEINKNDKALEKLIKVGDPKEKEKLRNDSIQLVEKIDKNDNLQETKILEMTVEKIGIVIANDSEGTNPLLNDGNNLLEKLEKTDESREVNLLLIDGSQSIQKLKTIDHLNGTDKLRTRNNQEKVDDSLGTEKLRNDDNVEKLDKVGDLKRTDILMEKLEKVDDAQGTNVLVDSSSQLEKMGKVDDSREIEVYRSDGDDVELLGKVNDSQEMQIYKTAYDVDMLGKDQEVYNSQEMEFYRTDGDVEILGKVDDLQGTTDLRNGNNDSTRKIESVNDTEVEFFRNDANQSKMLIKVSNEMGSEEFSNKGEQYGINIDEIKTVINSHQPGEELLVNNNDSMELNIGEDLMYQKKVENDEEKTFDNVGGYKEIPKKVPILDALAELVIPIMEFENECETMEWGQMSEMLVEDNVTKIPSTVVGESEDTSLEIRALSENSNLGRVGLTLEEVRLETGMKTYMADGHPNSSPSTRSCASSETLTDPELCTRELGEGVQDGSNLNMNSVELADVVIVENNSFIALEDAAKQSQELSVREIEQAMGMGPGEAEGCIICKEGGQQFIIVNGELSELAHVLGVESNKKSDFFDVGGQQYVLNENGELVLFNDSRSSNAQVRRQTSIHGETSLTGVDQGGHPTLDQCQRESSDPLFANPEQSAVPISRGKTTKTTRGRGRGPGRPKGKWKRKSRAKPNPGFLGPTQGLISRKERDEINNAVIAISEENNWHTNPKALNLSFFLEEESNSGLNFEKNPDSPPRNDYSLRPEFNDGKILGPTQGLVTRKEREELNRIVLGGKDDTNWYLRPRDQSSCGSKPGQSILKDSDRRVMESGSMMSAKIYNDWIQSTSNKEKNHIKSKKVPKQNESTSTRKNRNVKKVTETEESWMDSTQFKKVTTYDELNPFENNNSDVDDPNPVEDNSAFHPAANEVNGEIATNNDAHIQSLSNFVDHREQSTSFYPSGDDQNHSSYFSNDGTQQANSEKQAMGSSFPSYANSYNYQSNDYQGYPNYGPGYSSCGYQANYNNNKPSGATGDQPLLDLSQQNQSTGPYSNNMHSSGPLGYESFMGQFGNSVTGSQDLNNHQNMYNNEYNGQNVNYQNMRQQMSHQYGEGTNYQASCHGYQQYLNNYYKAYGYSGACNQEQFQAMMKHWYNQGGGMYQRYYYNLYQQYYNYHYPSFYSQHGYYPPPSNPLTSQENNFEASTSQSPNPEPNPEVTRGITSDESSDKNDTQNDREVCGAAKDDETQEILPNMKDEKTDSPWSMRDVVESNDSVDSAEQNFGCGPEEFVFVDDSGYPQLYEDENSELLSPTWDQTKVFARRKRVSYSKAMLDALMVEYSRCVYLTQASRERLSNSLGISEDRILIWFKNQRMKDKLKENGGRAGDFKQESDFVKESAGRRAGDVTEEEVDYENNIDNHHPSEIAKGGRRRAHYSSAMLDTLMYEYNRSMYLTPGARSRLCTSLGLSEDRILTWFKNQRSKDKLRIEAQGRSDYDHLGEQGHNEDSTERIVHVCK